MDFIQSAIEKARAERQRQGQAGPGPSAADPAAAGPAEGRPAGDERAALWAALPEFRPQAARLERNRVFTHRGGAEAGHFDMMRTKLLHQMRANRWRRLAITSPGRACGKTMLSLNLALSLARQPDIRVMGVEFDMRRPSMARVLGLDAPGQFGDVLAGRGRAEDHLVRIGRNLALGVNAAPVPQAAELLQGAGAGRAMDAVEARYGPDVMVFDMAPMLATDDTLAFIDQIDCVLLVAAAESTTMDEVTRCSEELAARCNFLGVVLNKCRYIERGDAYSYGYGYS